MHIHTHLKKTVLLFTLAVFFAGQIAATPPKTGIPSLPEKSWYTRHKKPLIIAAVVFVSLAGLRYYDKATTLPNTICKVIDIVTLPDGSQGLSARVEGQNFLRKSLKGLADGNLDLKNQYGDTYQIINGWHGRGKNHELRRTTPQRSLRARLMADGVALLGKVKS